jgi:hypothetical protein
VRVFYFEEYEPPVMGGLALADRKRVSIPEFLGRAVAADRAMRCQVDKANQIFCGSLSENEIQRLEAASDPLVRSLITVWRFFGWTDEQMIERFRNYVQEQQ